MRANPFKSGSAFVVRGPRSAGGRKLTLDDELYTRQEAQEALGIGSKALSQLVASQEIPHVTTPPPGGYAAEEGASRFTGRRSASTKGLPIPLANITRAELTSRFSTNPQTGQR